MGFRHGKDLAIQEHRSPGKHAGIQRTSMQAHTVRGLAELDRGPVW